MEAVGLLPGEQDLRGGAGEHRERRADRDRVAQTDGPLGRGDADALVALAAEELRALVGVVAQGSEHGTGCREQTVLARGRGELAEPRTEHEASLHVPRHETVVLERDGQTVGRGTCESGGSDELGEGGWARLEGAEHRGGLVENTDP